MIGQITTTVNGKTSKRREFSWQQMNAFAEELALREPATYPILAERARLERAAHHGKEVVAPEIDPPVAA